MAAHKSPAAEAAAEAANEAVAQMAAMEANAVEAADKVAAQMLIKDPEVEKPADWIGTAEVDSPDYKGARFYPEIEYDEADASKFVLIGYGIKELKLRAGIEDAKVYIDEPQEMLCEVEDFIQSVDIAVNLPLVESCDDEDSDKFNQLAVKTLVLRIFKSDKHCITIYDKRCTTKQWDKDINLECHAEYSTTKKPYTLSRHVSKLIVITAIEEDEDDDSYNVLD